MSDEKKESRFLKKWKLVRAAARDKARLSMGDVAVLMALCDRYGSKYDPDAPALAGHALLGAMSGLSRRATIDSTRRLVDAGYITVLELGSGTRGTRYGLNFASGEDVITTKPDSASGEVEFTTVVNPSAPLDPLSGEACFTESPPTESRLQAGLHVVGNKFEAAPLAPPVVGLTATTADTASGGGDGFSEFWKVWPRKHGIKKAQAEWAKILNDVDIIIEVAGDWATHYKEHGIDKRWIPEPANWLSGERWKEDLPIIHGDAKGAAIAKAKANAPVQKSPKAGPRTVDIIAAVLEQGTVGKTFLALTFCERDTPRTWDHIVAIEHPDISVQSDGLREFKELCDAVALPNINDSAELEGCSLRILQTAKGKLEYLPDLSEPALSEAA
ncbi:hypothetical protein [Neorhizobium galegae]|uniref:hypothetical protein n=1 Tax=Neorhizobium galegae TaxID=399 RepID=UPI00126A800D|nr:hypothetical protein [Neorhizobium galegae]KAA9386904.1 hypothetical protein F4V88_10700 [Neorhizobium galegae]MCM2498045.1 hypothetical protein [Neorhizobium galegae]